MQFKVVSALALVTLVAAGAIPPPPASILPPPAKTDLPAPGTNGLFPPASNGLPPPAKDALPPPANNGLPPAVNHGLPPRAAPNSNPANTNANSANTNPANTNPANTNPANTNQVKSNPAKSNPSNTNASKIAPPFPGNPLPTVAASKCTTGHLRCCKSAQSPTAASVSPLLTPFGMSASTLSGFVGITCTEISVIDAGPNSCSGQPVCCTDNSFGDGFSLGCNLVNLSL